MLKLIIYSFMIFAIGMLSGHATRCNADMYLNIHGASYHHTDREYYIHGTNETKPFNEINPGFGLEYSFNNHYSIRGGFYENSVYKNSIYTLVSAHSSNSRLLGVGIHGGIVSGYYNTVNNAPYNKKLNPVIMPAVFINTGPARLEFGYYPGVFTFTTGVKF